MAMTMLEYFQQMTVATRKTPTAERLEDMARI